MIAAVSAIVLAGAIAGCAAAPEEPEGEVASEVVTVPAPARVLTGTALFVVADASAVGPGDLAVRQRLQGLGLTVTTKSDGVVRASDASGTALVVISSSVDSTLIGTMFRDTPVPLVTWEHALYDELGMATAADILAGQTGINVVHAAHPTAAGRHDAVTVLSTSGNVRWGTPGAGAAIVAYASGSTSRATQFVYEAGARLTTGAAAPARRVGTFLDAGSSQQLTADGWALFDAGVVWAAASGRPVPAVAPACALSGQALLVVADANAVGAGDAAVRRRLEDLGLRVVVKSDEKVRVTDATGVQLIVISSSVDSTIVGTMFRDTAVPLVTWEHALYDALAMAVEDGGSDGDQQTIDIVDSAHPLAASLSGNIRMLTSRGAVRWGKPVPAAVVVARSHASAQHAVHFAIESGAALVGGRIAPARRVGTFLDTESSQSLSPAGWELFDAAVVWAMGGGATRPVAWLVTGDHPLEPGDAAVKARLEALGFGTRVVRQSTLQENSLAGVRLVVVSESTQSAEIGDYFTGRPVPVVIAEYNLLDDMGMANARGTVSGQREIDIVRPASRLAGGQSGRVRVYNDGMEVLWGVPRSTAEVVATVKGDAGKATVFGYETGAAMFGLVAPARRVGLFMFHGNNLTTAGWALFDASVSWAAAPGVENACGAGSDVDLASCMRSFCDSSGCHQVARADGSSCKDGLYCTVDDVCQAGVCVGTPRTCDESVDSCTTSVCDEAADACVAAPRGADCPISCTSGIGLDAYRDGWRAGHHRVHRAWRKSDDCDALEAFLDRVSLRLEELMAGNDPSAPPTERACRISGKFDGSVAALDEIQTTCDHRCVMSGEVVGHAASAAYCELAIGAAGAIQVDAWLRGPVNLCGLSHETTCDSVFIDETRSYGNTTGTCEPYTRAPFFDVWDNSRERSCDYQNRTP